MLGVFPLNNPGFSLVEAKSTGKSFGILLGMKSDQIVDTFGCFPGSILGPGRDQVSA